MPFAGRDCGPIWCSKIGSPNASCPTWLLIPAPPLQALPALLAAAASFHCPCHHSPPHWLCTHPRLLAPSPLRRASPVLLTVCHSPALLAAAGCSSWRLAWQCSSAVLSFLPCLLSRTPPLVVGRSRLHPSSGPRSPPPPDWGAPSQGTTA